MNTNNKRMGNRSDPFRYFLINSQFWRYHVRLIFINFTRCRPRRGSSSRGTKWIQTFFHGNLFKDRLLIPSLVSHAWTGLSLDLFISKRCNLHEEHFLHLFIPYHCQNAGLDQLNLALSRMSVSRLLPGDIIQLHFVLFILFHNDLSSGRHLQAFLGSIQTWMKEVHWCWIWYRCAIASSCPKVRYEIR